MKQPIIGISANECSNIKDDTAPNMSYVVTNFVEAVTAVGGLPLLLPIGEKDTAKTYISLIDKLILTGGQHVSPCFYHEEKSIVSKDYSFKRDVFELALIEEAILQNKPIFSVCRGTQLFNVAMGGTLHQAIAHHWQSSLATQAVHEINVEPSSILATIYGTTAMVNSFHRQSINILAKNLQTIAYSSQDNIIEAITTTNGYRYLGVQWHPELLFQQRKEDYDLFKYVVHQL